MFAHLRADIWVHLSTYLGMNSDWSEHCRHVTQGKLVLKDFNIQELAGNSFIGVDKTFVAQVSNGVLDIHLFYAGKGTCCTSDGRWSYGPLISAISAKNVLNRENLESSFCLPILMLRSTILGCQLLCNLKNDFRGLKLCLTWFGFDLECRSRNYTSNPTQWCLIYQKDRWNM